MSNRTDNFCMFIGRVGKDPEKRFTPSGLEAASFSLAISERTRQEDGTYVDGDPTWVNFTAIDKTAALVNRIVKKGQKLLVHAKYQSRKYNKEDGSTGYYQGFQVDTFNVLVYPAGAQASSGSNDDNTSYDTEESAPF